MKKITLLTLGLMFILCANAQETFDFGVLYKGDFGRNFSGGIDTGNGYMGLLSLNATVNTNGGNFYVDLQNTHGTFLSQEYVGDYQFVSNIENGFGYSNYTYLYELWYKHTINNSTLLFGIHNLNAEFLVSDNAGHFMNASFGIMPSVSCNVYTSIFPVTTLGALFKQSIKEVDVKVGIYNGFPKNESESFGFDKFHFDEEYLLISEVVFNKISTKMGAYYHSNDVVGIRDTNDTFNGNYGVYWITDQVLYEINDNRDISSFLKVGFAPTDRNVSPIFVGGGVLFNGTFLKRDNDVIGLAFAHNQFNKFYNDFENTIECFYQYNLNKRVMIQPEVQYIISPNLNSGLSNATVGLVRLQVQLN